MDNLKQIYTVCNIALSQTSVKVLKFIAEPLGVDVSSITVQDVRTIIQRTVINPPTMGKDANQLTSEEQSAFKAMIDFGVHYYNSINKERPTEGKTKGKLFFLFSSN